MKTKIKFKSLEALVEDSMFEYLCKSENAFVYNKEFYCLKWLGCEFDLDNKKICCFYDNDVWTINNRDIDVEDLKLLSDYNGYIPNSVLKHKETYFLNIEKDLGFVNVNQHQIPYSEAKKFMNMMLEVEGYERIK